MLLSSTQRPSYTRSYRWDITLANLPHNFYVRYYHRYADHYLLVLDAEILYELRKLTTYMYANIIDMQTIDTSSYHRDALPSQIPRNPHVCYYHRRADYHISILAIETLLFPVRSVSIYARHYRHKETNDTRILTAEISSKPKAPYTLCIRCYHRHTNHHTLVPTLEMLF